MGDLFDIANLITTVGVDAVKIKPEPGLPEKSSNEILTELFSTFEVPDDDDDDESETEQSNPEEAQKQEDKQTEEKSLPVVDVNIKLEKVDEQETPEIKKKKVKKKHKHKNDKDKEKKHKHKKKSKHNSSESATDADNGGSKKKKKKKKSKRKHEDSAKDANMEEPNSKIRKLDKSNKNRTKDNKKENFVKSKMKTPELIKIKTEKKESDNETTESQKKEGSPVLPPISKRLDDDIEALEVPKLLEKTKNSVACKIQIKDLKNSEVFNNTVKEIENKKKEKAERMEDGELSDSEEEENINNNRTPTLSPTPPRDQDSKIDSSYNNKKKNSVSPSSSRSITKKKDLRIKLKDKEKKKPPESNHRSRSRTCRKDNKGSNKSKDRDNKRSRSCQSREKRTRSGSVDKGRRGRSRSRDRRDSRRRDRDRRSRDRRDKLKSHSEERNRSRWRERSRSRERKERIEIDKKKLLEIARKNAINMIIKGKLPLAQQDKVIAAIQNGGKTIDELTDFCKSLSKSEAMGELSSISSDDESNSEKGFHHPFLIKERPNSIIMNIRDSKQIPTKTFLEKTTEASNTLRLQFPVSSGQHHRKNESEWIPVPPKPNNKNSKPEPKKLFVPAKEILQPATLPLVVPPIQSTKPLVQVVPPLQSPVPDAQAIPVPETVQQPSIFPPTTEPIDVSAIVSQRLAAMRKLSENPFDVQALHEMHKAQSGMQTWVESKQLPGQFTGSTGAKVLSPAELNSGHQAWARKDQLLTAQPLSGGMGMALLQKMGWRPGEGLGKNKEGTLEPLQLEVKLDKRGLISDQDIGAAKLGKMPKVASVKGVKAPPPMIKTLEGKHPVSLLGEFCSKRKYGAPVYELCLECGPDHKKNFIFKVKVNGVEYKPAVASPNKKLAKAEAAQVCLQTIGLLP